MKTLVGWAVIAFAVFYLLSNPDGAAALVAHSADGLRSAANSLASFLDSL